MLLIYIQQSQLDLGNNFEYFMGIFSSSERKALEEAKSMREELYRRVDTKKNMYKQAFQEIDANKKKKIVQASALEIVSMIQESYTTSLQVLLCFIERSATIGIENSYILDEMFQEAVREAIAVDEQRKKYPEKKSLRNHSNKQDCFPPFYGVPLSVKQTFLMKGRQTHAGYVSKVNPIPQEESCFIEMVRNMGFIPFVRSNVSQGCKTFETNNNMFGYAKNPWDLTRSTGGSSGGQGGMVASCCSPIGIGSDLGGSLRIPAQFNGLCTLKAGQRSITRLGNAFYGKYSGGSAVKSQFNAIAKSVSDLIQFNAYMFDPKNYSVIDPIKLDPYLNLIPFDYSFLKNSPKFRIGLTKRLDTIKTSQTHERALDQCCELLKSMGHEIVPVKLHGMEDLYLMIISMFTCDQKMGVFEELRQSEPFIKEYKIMELMSKIPWLIRRAIIYLIKKKQPRLARMIETSKPLTVRQMFESLHNCQTVISRQTYEVFIRNKLDVILLPGFACSAPKLGEIGRLQYFFALNSPWNTIAYPAGSLPVTIVRRGETEFEDQFNDFYTNNIRKSMKGSEGMPVGIQIVALPKQDEKILYIMKILEDRIKFRENFPCPIRL